jgi:hypothetical protein
MCARVKSGATVDDHLCVWNLILIKKSHSFIYKVFGWVSSRIRSFLLSGLI